MKREPIAAVFTVAFFLSIIGPISVAAVNDPGHDTLYVEQEGNSTLNGTLNITMDLRVAQRIFSDYLDVRGDETFTGSTNRIIGTSTDLYLESTGDIIINDQIGTTNMFRLGFSGDSVNLNVTGNAYVQGSSLTVGGVAVCLADGTNCQAVAGSSSAGGWTNNSQNTSTTLNVGVGTTRPNATLDMISTNAGGAIKVQNASDILFFINTSNGYVGIGTQNTPYALTVGRQGTLLLGVGEFGNIVIGSTFQDVDSIYGGGGVYRVESTGQIGFSGSQAYNAFDASFMRNASGVIEVNDGTLGSRGKLLVAGLNASNTIYEAGSRVCTAANGLCSGASSNSAGGWRNTTTFTTTSRNVNVTNSGGSSKFFVNATSGRVGLGTVNPASTLHLSVSAGTDAEIRLSDGDVTHGMTNLVPTNVFALMQPYSSTQGGFAINGLSDADAPGILLFGHIGSSDPTDTVPAIWLIGAKRNSADRQALAAQETVFKVDNLGTNAMVLMGNGRLGINNTDPNSTLHVRGNASITGNLYEAGSRVCTAANGLCGSSTTFAWLNNSAEVYTALRVGINTTDPNSTLHVLGTANITGKVDLSANTTYHLGGQSKVCFEKFRGTTYNYSRCVNASGHVTERVGIFNLNS